MKEISLEIEGSVYKGLVQKIKGELWIHLQGKTYCYKPVEDYSQGGGTSAEDASLIKAPMPGKIIKIKNTVGNDASKDEVLVVMEAMKMEYNLKASGDCKVKEILCKEGEQVALGQVLIKLEVQDD